MLNIAVFYGGKSSEHDVSVVTALQMMEIWTGKNIELFPFT